MSVAYSLDFHDRHYDPRTGRFILEDPIQFAGNDTNLYRSVENNPINSTDPSGFGAIGGAAGAAGVLLPWLYEGASTLVTYGCGLVAAQMANEQSERLKRIREKKGACLETLQSSLIACGQKQPLVRADCVRASNIAFRFCEANAEK